AKMLVIGIRSDLLFPTYQQKEIVDICEELGKDVVYYEMNSPWGHDAFLVDYHMIDPVIRGFLAGLSGE
ncbi:MAG: homoserine O-acetyltransferase, partial [Actinobacteria bacterium]|nr:homoserine O-acetyltransferase [Actinomycetota bacterium]